MPGTALARRTSSPSVKRPSLPFLHAAVAESDDHIHLLRLAENLHHLPGGLDGVGERRRAATGVEHGLLAEHPEDAEANAAALDHEVAADHALPWPGAGDRPALASSSAEAGIRGEHRRNPAGLGGHADGLAQAVRPEVELMVAEGGGVVAHPAHELQFAAGLAAWRRRTRSPCCSRPRPAPAPDPGPCAPPSASRSGAARRAYPPRVVSSLSVNGV